MPVAIVEPRRAVRNADHRTGQELARITHRASKGTPQVESEIRIAVVGEPAGQADRLGHRFLSKTRDASLPSSRGREQVPRGGAIPATVPFTREMDFMRRTVGQLIVTSTMTSVEPRAFIPQP